MRDSLSTDDVFDLEDIDIHLAEGMVFLEFTNRSKESFIICLSSKEAEDFSTELWSASKACEGDNWKDDATNHSKGLGTIR